MSTGDGGRRLLREILRRRRRSALAGGLCWSSHQICEGLVPVAFGLVIDRAVRTGDGTAMVISVAAILGLFSVLTMSWRAGMWFTERAMLEEAHTLRLGLVETVLRADHVSERQRGEQLSIVTSDTQRAASMVETVAWLAAASVGLTTAAVLLLRIDWVLGLGIVASVPLLMAGVSALGPRLKRRTAAQQEGVGLAAALAADLLAGLRPLRGFGGIPEATARYRRISRISLDASVGAARARGAFAGLTVLATGLLLAVIAAVSGGFAASGRISVGELITVLGLAAWLTDPVSILADAIRAVAEARASAERVSELGGTVTAEVDAGGELSGDLELCGVRAPGLSDVSFSARRGELVGVVVPSAVAAASLVALLSGDPPEAGEVRVGRAVLADTAPGILRRQVLVEPHAVDLFGTTIREAVVTSGDPSDVSALAALDAAAVYGITERSMLLDHALNERGTNLSGGQRQRVALARALLTERPVIVLRDPTTAVDGVTESLLAEGLRRVRIEQSRGDLVTMVITSSPPLLSRCDRVIYLGPDGSVHSSRHEDLTADPGYAELVLR